MLSNLPPGCTQGMIDRAFGDEGPCDICGHAVDDCICPECPECGACGDRNCYHVHGLKVTPEQVLAWHKFQIMLAREALADAEMAADMVECDLSRTPDDPDYWPFEPDKWAWIAKSDPRD